MSSRNDRPDEKLLYEQQFHVISKLLCRYFEGKYAKVLKWWLLPNPFLGGVKPFTLLRSGRGHVVLNYVMQSKDEHGW